jgi:hypothetical protein
VVRLRPVLSQPPAFDREFEAQRSSIPSRDDEGSRSTLRLQLGIAIVGSLARGGFQVVAGALLWRCGSAP